MQALDRAVPKSELIEQYENCDGLTEEMKERMKEYLLSLHGKKENTKGDYLSKIKMFGIFLSKHGIARFEDVKYRLCCSLMPNECRFVREEYVLTLVN